MIKRRYFFRVESRPLLKQKRLANGMVTVASCIVTHKSWFPDQNEVYRQAINNVISKDEEFLEDEIMITAMSRL